MPRQATMLEFMEQSTLHGLREIAVGRKARERVFHITLVLVSYSATVYGIYHIMSSYSTKPVVSTILFQEGDTLDLPDISLCLFNRLDRYYFEKHDVPEILRMFMEWTFFPVNPAYGYHDPVQPLMAFYRPSKGIDISRELTETMRRLNVTDLRTIIHDASFKCTDIVQNCHMAEPWQRGSEECCAPENIEYHTSDFGRCLRVLSKPQIIPGVLHGMRFALRIPVDNFSYSETMLLNDGIQIKLSEKDAGLGFDAIFSPIGVHTLLQLQAYRLKFKDDPPRYRCKDTNISLNQCYRQCKLRMIQDNCSCSYITDESIKIADFINSTTRPPRVRTCTSMDMLNCTYEYLFANEQTIGKVCRGECYQPCNYWEFTATVTYSRIDPRRNQHDWIFLDVYFDKISFTQLKHHPSMTFDNFVADIGGQVGLWMGGSILSIIHLLVFTVLWSFARREKQQRKMRRENTEETVKTIDTGLM